MHDSKPFNIVCTSVGLSLLLSACASRGLPEEVDYGANDPVEPAPGPNTQNGDGDGSESSGNGSGGQTGTAPGDEDIPPSETVDSDAGGFGPPSTGSGSGGFMIPDFGDIFGDDDASVPALSDSAPQMEGALVISELIANPVGSTSHEWIELYNPGASTFNLIGCRLASGSTEHVIREAVFSAPGSYVVLARDEAASDGLAPLYTYEHVSLSSSGDELALKCGSVEIDSMHYETEQTERAQSTQLSATLLDANANDDLGAWCLGTTPIGASENQGTPGATNRICP